MPKNTRKQRAGKRGSKPRPTPIELPPATPVKKLASALVLTKMSAGVIWGNKRLFAGIVLVYALLTLILVKGLAGGVNVSELKQELNDVFAGGWGDLASGLSIFAIMVGSFGSGGGNSAAAYQFFLTIITSLAVIWSLRQVTSGRNPRLRDGYYLGMYPLVPFILTLLVVGLQLLPMLIGATIYSTVITNGIAIHLLEKIFWLAVFIGLSLLSLYLITSSVMALYVVSLPEMTPLKALRSARELVKGRHWLVLRKIISLPLILLVASVAIMLPIILWLTAVAEAAFFLLSMASLVVVHAYLYSLYRELLDV